MMWRGIGCCATAPIPYTLHALRYASHQTSNNHGTMLKNCDPQCNSALSALASQRDVNESSSALEVAASNASQSQNCHSKLRTPNIRGTQETTMLFYSLGLRICSCRCRYMKHRATKSHKKANRRTAGEHSPKPHGVHNFETCADSVKHPAEKVVAPLLCSSWKTQAGCPQQPRKKYNIVSNFGMQLCADSHDSLRFT